MSSELKPRVLVVALVLTAISAKLYAAPFSAGGDGMMAPWIDVDYLLLETTGMELPPLVTGNPFGTPANETALGDSTTSILIGNQSIFESARSGMRYRGGIWFGASRRVGVEAEYFSLSNESSSFRIDASNELVLSRPYIDVRTAESQFASEVRDSPAFISVSARSEFDGAATRLRLNIIAIGGGGAGALAAGCGCASRCDDCCDSCDDVCCDCCDCCCGGGAGGAVVGGAGGGCVWWADATVGYRYLNFNESLRIRDQHSNNNGNVEIDDLFNTSSEFHGIEVGAETGFAWGYVGLTWWGRLAAGASNNLVAIYGETAYPDTEEFYDSGFLAQDSNIGLGTDTSPAFVSEFGFNVDLHLWEGLTCNAGYSVLFWSSVQRAGEQVDLHVNPNLFPLAANPNPNGIWRFAHGCGK